ncbi:MAG: hypothetical protein C0408_05290 [Odoribacter sp.]|nr:hypothetical protein [Odoribacter sp.]
MKIRIFVLQLLVILLVTLVSCRRNHFKADISEIKFDINIKRLEADLFSLNPAEIKNKIPELFGKYDGFLNYFGYVINIGEINDSTWGEGLVRFCTDKLNNEVYAATVQVYPDLENVEKELTRALRHYRYYFPGKQIPGIFTCITGFNNSIIVGDSVLGIGLDKYLGADSRYYRELQIYKYQIAKMNPHNIVPDCMYAWAASEWNYKEMGYATDNVLTEMLHEGKLLYFVKSMLPEHDDNFIFGFTAGQMKFCINNENQIWQYLVEHNLLFSSDHLTRRKLTGEAPFTAYFSKESPGRAAVWTGFRIIESYMNTNRDVSLEDLMKDTDIHGILERARYDPK